jgi:hypothetical protein
VRKKRIYHANTNDTLTVHNLCNEQMAKHLDIVRELTAGRLTKHKLDNAHRFPTPVQAHRCLIQQRKRDSVTEVFDLHGCYVVEVSCCLAKLRDILPGTIFKG